MIDTQRYAIEFYISPRKSGSETHRFNEVYNKTSLKRSVILKCREQNNARNTNVNDVSALSDEMRRELKLLIEAS